jgi:hypothetical protein
MKEVIPPPNEVYILEIYLGHEEAGISDFQVVRC